MLDLKPCPFCGEKATLIHHRSEYSTDPTTIRDEFKAGCERCGVFIGPCRSKIWMDKNGELHCDYNGAETAANAWNRRETDNG